MPTTFPAAVNAAPARAPVTPSTVEAPTTLGNDAAAPGATLSCITNVTHGPLETSPQAQNRQQAIARRAVALFFQHLYEHGAGTLDFSAHNVVAITDAFPEHADAVPKLASALGPACAATTLRDLADAIGKPASAVDQATGIHALTPALHDSAKQALQLHPLVANGPAPGTHLRDITSAADSCSVLGGFLSRPIYALNAAEQVRTLTDAMHCITNTPDMQRPPPLPNLHLLTAGWQLLAMRQLADSLSSRTSYYDNLEAARADSPEGVARTFTTLLGMRNAADPASCMLDTLPVPLRSMLIPALVARADAWANAYADARCHTVPHGDIGQRAHAQHRARARMALVPQLRSLIDAIPTGSRGPLLNTMHLLLANGHFPRFENGELSEDSSRTFCKHLAARVWDAPDQR